MHLINLRKLVPNYSRHLVKESASETLDALLFPTEIDM